MSDRKREDFHAAHPADSALTSDPTDAPFKTLEELDKASSLLAFDIGDHHRRCTSNDGMACDCDKGELIEAGKRLVATAEAYLARRAIPAASAPPSEPLSETDEALRDAQELAIKALSLACARAEDFGRINGAPTSTLTEIEVAERRANDAENAAEAAIVAAALRPTGAKNE